VARHLQSDNIEFIMKRLREPIDADNHRQKKHRLAPYTAGRIMPACLAPQVPNNRDPANVVIQAGIREGETRCRAGRRWPWLCGRRWQI
jgi:hypothetical protein